MRHQIAIGVTELVIQRTAASAHSSASVAVPVMANGRQKASRYKATFIVFPPPENTRAEGTARLINRYEH